MASVLLISVRLHEGRYHGTGERVPSPARLFQALVAGAGLGGPLNADTHSALLWLEQLVESPVIAAPPMLDGQGIRNFVPNNDLDAVGGDQRRVGEIRVQKLFKPRFFDAEIPFLFAWRFDGNEANDRQAQQLCSLAERVYQFGRGVDFAWACGEVLESPEFDERLMAYPGVVYRPSGTGDGMELACPTPGSVKSLRERHQAHAKRFAAVRQGRTVKQRFSQPPKPRFAQVAYDSPPVRRVYELCEKTTEAPVAWPLSRVVSLVEAVRDEAVARLRKALPERDADIERFLVGRKADGSDSGPTSLRVRIVPLPSIGFHHVDRDIRRLLVEVPAGCPLRADDMHWAMSGVEPVDSETQSPAGVVVTPSTDERMLKHYGVGELATHVWRSVTPVALAESARRRRIDPARKSVETKAGPERAAEQRAAGEAVVQALRHADVRAAALSIRVQREPFEAKGQRVESFAPGTRFAKDRLWHVEVTFRSPVSGPLVIGDGRFLGLGIMSPVQQIEGVLAFAIDAGMTAPVEPVGLARALRRAVMARVQDVLGPGARLPTFYTGHERDGSVAQTEKRPHLAFTFDPVGSRLLIIAPHLLARRQSTREEIAHLQTLHEALADLSELRAGSAGRLVLRPVRIDVGTDPLFVASKSWESVTPYQVTRHTKGVGAAAALSADLVSECRRRGLPAPRVTPREIHGQQGVGLIGHATLAFEVAIEGPIILGRSRYVGGGLFTGRD